MADQSDVEKALVTAIAAALYPGGAVGNPPETIAGAPARILRGWPDQVKLDADLAAGVVNVSVFPRPNMERITTRYQPIEQPLALKPFTYTLTASGQAVTIGGVPPSTYYPQNLAVFVDGLPFVVTAAAGETAAQVAADMCALISQTVSGVTVAGATLTFDATLRISALVVGTTAQTITEIGRQEKQFLVAIWAPTPDLRDAVAKAVAPALRKIDFLPLAEGTNARLRYQGTNSFDGPQKERLYRRDLFYRAEYPETELGVVTQIVVAEALFPDFKLLAPDGSLLFDLDFSSSTNSQFLPGV